MTLETTTDNVENESVITVIKRPEPLKAIEITRDNLAIIDKAFLSITTNIDDDGTITIVEFDKEITKNCFKEFTHFITQGLQTGTVKFYSKEMFIKKFVRMSVPDKVEENKVEENKVV